MSAAGSNERRSWEWFQAACDLPEHEWEPFLERGCDDAELRAEVLDLLRRDKHGARVLGDPPPRTAAREELARLGQDLARVADSGVRIADSGLRVADSGGHIELVLRAEAPPPAERIGGYRIVRRLGGGSMGTVYEATAPSTGARVALKVLRTSLPSPALLHRFRREAEALARLDHPCIARIHEAGTADLGVGTHPFLAMELVDGVPIDRYCEREAASTSERLALLASIGEGVQHAHERGVIHRDLKPGNVLVDASGRPRILDFGVARLTPLGAEDPAGSLHTATGQLLGTLQTMSPEQASGGRAAIDARADVYSLGVLGYELLAGLPPYDVERCPLPEALRRIRESAPPLLGARKPELRGAIEAVFARSLEKDPERRYPTMQAFVDDLRAVLEARPVRARVPGLVGQARRLAARNPAFVRATGAFVALLLLGIGGTTWGWLEARATSRRIDAARADAQAAYHESEAVIAFLEEMLGALKVDERGSNVRLRDVLALAAPRLDEAFPAEPRVAARLHFTLGVAYQGIADHERADHHFGEVERLLAGAGPDSIGSIGRLFSARLNRAAVAMEAGRFADALAMLARARDEMRALPPGSLSDDVRAGADRMQVRAHKLAGDEIAAEQVLHEERDVEELDPVSAEDLRIEQATTAFARGDTRAAEDELRAVLAARRERVGPDAVVTVEAAGHLANVLTLTGRFAEAEELLRHRAAVLADRLGPEHPQTLHARGRVAFLLNEAGRGAEALVELDDLLALSRRVLGDEHPRTASLLCTLSAAAMQSGREDGPALTDAALALGRRVYGDRHSDLLPVLSNAAYAEIGRGDYDEAVGLLLEAHALCENTPLVHAAERVLIDVNLCGLLVALRRFGEADDILPIAAPRARTVCGERHPQTITLTNLLADAHVRHERWDEAEALYDGLLALELGDAHYNALSAKTGLGAVYAHTGREDQAEPLLRAALEGALEHDSHDPALAARCRQNLAAFLTAQGREDEAAEL